MSIKKMWSYVVQTLGVYFFTFLGIVLSQYAPLLLKEGSIDTPFQWIRLGISAAIALYIVVTDETQGDAAGKAANLKKRLSTAFAHGYMWNGLMGLAGQAASVSN